jgi:coatomer subunit beta
VLTLFADILIVNQTSDTLQNLVVEFATFGDLKLVEKPSQYNLGPHSFLSIKASLKVNFALLACFSIDTPQFKVSSTETGIIFGNIVFDTHGATENTVIVMNDIHLDVIDYINPDIIAETTVCSFPLTLPDRTQSFTFSSDLCGLNLSGRTRSM